MGRVCFFEQQQLGAVLFEWQQLWTILIVFFIFDVVFAPIFRPPALIESEMIAQTAPQQGAVLLWAAANCD